MTKPPTQITDPEPTVHERRKTQFLLKQLYPLAADRADAQWALGRSSKEIGRAADLQKGIRLDGPRVSAQHAGLNYQDGDYVLQDLGSTNGTFVNLHRIKEHRLRSGDIIRIGGTLLLFREQPARSYPSYADLEGEILGASPEIQELRHLLVQAAGSPNAVLLQGPTGTGKELAARALHQRSGRSGKLVSVNCAAISPGLAESTLFGHVRGAFTGADQTYGGVFRDAHLGTLFLDELGEMPLELQAKLLRVLETRQVQSLGSAKVDIVDVRVIAATNRILRDEVNQDRFRSDLHARFPLKISLPSLRDRKEDILPLFAKFYGQPLSKVPLLKAFSLLVHQWPQNVRELANAAAKAKTFGMGEEEEDISKLVDWFLPPDKPGPAHGEVKSVDGAGEAGSKPKVTKEALVLQLEEKRGVVEHVALDFQLSPRQLVRYIEQYGLDLSLFRKRKPSKS